MAFPLLEIFNIGTKLIDKLIPDPNAKAAAQLELMKLQQTGELAALAAEKDLALGQIEINKVEAANGSLFVSGWRPFIGWLIGVILATNYIFVPMLAWLSPLVDMAPPGRLELGELYPVLLGMLGLGGLRSYDKKQITG